MTLKDLTGLFGLEQERMVRIQIEDEEYDGVYNEFSPKTNMLFPFYDAPVVQITSIEKDIIRVKLDWRGFKELKAFKDEIGVISEKTNKEEKK